MSPLKPKILIWPLAEKFADPCSSLTHFLFCHNTDKMPQSHKSAKIQIELQSIYCLVCFVSQIIEKYSLIQTVTCKLPLKTNATLFHFTSMGNVDKMKIGAGDSYIPV